MTEPFTKEFTLTFSGPKVCSYCDGPVGEVALMDAQGGKFCDAVCAEAAAVAGKGNEMKISAKELADRIPVITAVEVAFPAGPHVDDVYDDLTPIGRQWVEDNPDSWGLRFFSDLFYKGGKVPAFKEIEGVGGITEDDLFRVLYWVRAAMGSFYPKHEDKEAVCGMLWATFFEEPAHEQ